MRASELLSSVVLDRSGRELGPVRDLRVRRVEGEAAGLEIAGLVVGDGPLAALAHAWGYAEGRSQGPWLLRRLTGGARRAARFIPAERVVDWGPGRVRVDAEFSQLAPLSGEARP